MREREIARRARAALALLAPLLILACGNPVSVRTVDPHDAYESRAASGLSTGEPSEMTRTNRAIVGAFRPKRANDLDPSSGVYSLPFGKIAVHMKKDALLWDRKDLVTLNTDALVEVTAVSGIPTSIDNMNPNSPFLKGLVGIPLAPGVTGHSIIAVAGDGPVEEGNDGVVEYSSAHIDGVASELVVESSHSCQPLPATIEEVRRILALHAEAVAAEGLRCGQ